MDACWSEAQTYFDEILGHIGSSQVASFGLTYIDKFIWTGRPEACRPTELLRTNSLHIAAKSFDARDLWHCHSGAFSRFSDTVKRLEVVDLDCLDEADTQGGQAPVLRRSIRIAINVVDLLNQPGYELHIINGQQAKGEMDSRFQNYTPNKSELSVKF
jgi:hypothetical protein